MADATTAAKDRIDRALASLERRVLELKARPASAPPVADDDLFAPRPVDAATARRLADLEAAAVEASQALKHAADGVRAVLADEV